jgi:hypothetical protein
LETSDEISIDSNQTTLNLNLSQFDENGPIKAKKTAVSQVVRQTEIKLGLVTMSLGRAGR